MKKGLKRKRDRLLLTLRGFKDLTIDLTGLRAKGGNMDGIGNGTKKGDVIEQSGSESELKELLATYPPTIDEVINRAAEHLPRGYIINLKVEHAGYTVEMVAPDGSDIENIDGGDGLISDINEAICIANGFSG